MRCVRHLPGKELILCKKRLLWTVVEQQWRQSENGSSQHVRLRVECGRQELLQCLFEWQLANLNGFKRECNGSNLGASYLLVL